MKFLLASTLAAALGVGWFGSTAEPAAVESSPCPIEDCCPLDDCCVEDCDVTCERLPDGTCLVECEGPDGETCWAIFGCTEDGECELLDCGGDCCAESCGGEVPQCAPVVDCDAKSCGDCSR